MANPLFNILGGNAPMQGPMGNMQQMVQQFSRFRQSYQGDPRAEVEKMLQSGRITQSQLNQVQQMAQQFAQFLK